MIMNSKVRHQEDMVRAQQRQVAQREALAAYAHEAWSGWMKYQLSKAKVNKNGTWTIPAPSVERWTRQMNTDFCDLPEAEKKSDFDEADKMLAIINQ